jgi:LuxR family maltose regulon positive regulatory protein
MASEAIIDPLLTTKLHRPAVGENHVHRPSLLERLDRRRSRPLTLVSAPAGYGKSVLISCWLEQCDIPSTWLSLDENDNDLHVFAAYFVAAVEKLFPEACRNTHALLKATVSFGLYYSGIAQYHRNELQNAEENLTKVIGIYKTASPMNYAHGAFALALT